MTSDRKQTGVAFWATVVVVVAAAYVLSAGPVSFLWNRGMLPACSAPPIMAFFAPLSWLGKSGPEPVREAIVWYVQLWQ
jgi:hypothetical protein